MRVDRESISVTTDGSGAATVYSSGFFSGIVNSLAYIKNNFDNGVVVTVTLEESGLTLWSETGVNASKTVYPVAAAALTTGAASTLTERPIMASNERIKIVIASGGNAKAGTFKVVVGG